VGKRKRKCSNVRIHSIGLDIFVPPNAPSPLARSLSLPSQTDDIESAEGYMISANAILLLRRL